MKVKDCFFINYPKMHRDSLEFGSLVLHEYSMIKPEWKLILNGVVESAPEGFTYKFPQDIQEGDKIFFKYLSANENNIYKEEEKQYLRVEASQVFAYERDGQIHAYGNYVLAKALWEDHEVTEVDGKEVKGKNVGGLFVVQDVKYAKNSAKLTHLNYQAKEEGLEVGDKIITLSYSDQKYQVNDEEFFVIEYDSIIGKYDD